MEASKTSTEFSLLLTKRLPPRLQVALSKLRADPELMELLRHPNLIVPQKLSPWRPASRSNDGKSVENTETSWVHKQIYTSGMIDGRNAALSALLGEPLAEPNSD